MIEEVIISNFQSHERTGLILSPYTNVIIGPSDSGKSAILRAINWVVNNRPSGDAFIRKGQEGVAVSIKIDGKTIIRKRQRNKENMYTIQEGEKDTMVLSAFGTTVPSEVSQIINMAELNIQTQLDPPFLISEGSSRAARYLNRVINLEAIDRTVSEISSRKRKATHNAKMLEELLVSAEEKLNQFNGLDAVGIKISRLEKVETEVVALESKIGKAHEIVTTIQDTEKRLTKDWGILDKEQERLVMITKEQKHINETNDLIREITSLCHDISKTKETLQNTSEIMLALQQEFDKTMPKTCPLCGRGN